ncbi:nucleotide sugar dehydrogenase [Alphaproteobacteria bacterium]|nr:nucleotide sugar dehydrogenase [Alphaproteobacteria bacterium]
MNKKIVIIGIGYVGLPLAISLSKFYEVIGFDNNLSRVKQLNNHIDINQQVKKNDIKKSKIKFTNKKSDIKESLAYIITVPTPVYKNNKPNLSMLKNASITVANVMTKKSLIIYESTVYPGLTRFLSRTIIEKISNLKLNKDFFLGYSPERINPGDKDNTLNEIVKIVSGSNEEAIFRIKNIYSKICKKIFLANSIEIAESAKIIENIQRDVNIALINEFYKIFSELDLNFDEILKAASTKWNFLKFKPGLVGGHCIGVDPYYLLHLTKLQKIKTEMVSSGRNVNDNMHKYIIQKINKFVKKLDKNPKNIKILIYGLTYKKDCPDIRNSQSNRISRILAKEYKVTTFDSLIDNSDEKKFPNFDKEYSKNNYDIIFINHIHTIDNKKFKFEKILKKKGLLYRLDKF